MSPTPLNILFIMADQMRADCLSGAGHPVLRTPNLDALAARGVRFREAHVQSAVCGPSRMCFYTGRYPHAHRSSWNEVPLPAGEKTMGHYFAAAGYRAALCGKTHYTPDPEAMPPEDPRRKQITHETLAGLEEWLRQDGVNSKAYTEYLRAKGYPEEVCKNPCRPVMPPDGAGGKDPSAFPTPVRKEDSDTAFVTDRALAFLRENRSRPWFLHLSYLKPHLPIFAPAPYHARYDPAAVPAPNRAPAELEDPHPLHVPYRIERRSLDYDKEPVWRQRRATYYGLIRELDDQLGRVFRVLDETGQAGRTLILFTSDHGEYVGDHWMFEKELFYDEAYRVPWIVYDPRPEANASRGTVCEAFVESLDALPTFLDAAGLEIEARLQGRSLRPWLRGEEPADWRTEVYADWDFRFYWTPKQLGLRPEQCRGWMVRDRRFKYWHFNGVPDVLFDLEKDPRELKNVAAGPAYAGTVRRYMEKLINWRMANEDVSRVAWTYALRPGFGRNPFASEGT